MWQVAYIREARLERDDLPATGRCAWRPLYKRVGDRFVVGAIAPEGGQDPRGFAQACERARQRFKELEGE